MDPAVALVQCYLRVNGYFTVAEYPVLEATRRGGYQMVTDLDLLAFRFPHAGRRVLRAPEDGTGTPRFAVDPELGVPEDEADMVIGEVKEGRAELNPGTRAPDVLGAAVTRFGCCSGQHAREVVEELLRHGRTRLPNGHRIRIVAFGAKTGGATGSVDLAMSLGHVTDFLRSYLEENWDVLRHAQFKEPTLGFLMTLEKARR